MAKKLDIQNPAFERLRWPIRLTWLGMFAERAALAFWPLVSVVLLALALLIFGVHLLVPLEFAWAGLVLLSIAGLIALVIGFRQFRLPTWEQSLGRIDKNLPGRPISAILDTQAIGSGDEASRVVWQAHQKRMTERTAGARRVPADIQTPRRDPFALRYVALLAFLMALIFGSVWRLTELDEVISGGAAYGATASWEGWVEPPAYTGKPSIYLPDVVAGKLEVPEGSRLTLRLYGEIGELTVLETVSARTDGIGSVAEANQGFEIAQSGTLEIAGPSGRVWDIVAVADMPPEVAISGPIERSIRGEMKLPFAASDDYGVQTGTIEIALDLSGIERRFGLAVEPEQQEKIILDLPMPFRGDRLEIEELLVENLSQHPWAGLPVSMELAVTDARNQVGRSEPLMVTLPGRAFFDPLAAALVEQRRYILWSKENIKSVAQVLRAVSNHPDDVFPSGADYLKLRVAINRLEAGHDQGGLTAELQTEIAIALWEMALTLEDGDLADARARLERAQERLEQAMRDGATDEEIAELMQELNEAMQDYLDLLAQEQQNDPNQTAENQDVPDITNQQLQEMLDEIQELMEQGRMAEAQQLMEELRQLLENMQITQSSQGEPSPGEQSMDDLAETLREQQDLSDQTFQDLQEQFGDQSEDQQGQQGEQGQPGPEGDQGQEGENGEPGENGTGGNQGQQPGQGGTSGSGQQEGDGQGRGAGNIPTPGLAERQQALRDQLNRQSGSLPGGSGSSASDARDALRRAEEAMEGAEGALRQQDYAGALDEQGRALEALREGMRELADDLAQQQNQQTGQQGDANGRAEAENNRDPLGRDAGASGQIGGDQRLLQGPDVYRRAQELLDEIRRRSSDQQRPEIELDYLRRLLDRF